MNEHNIKISLFEWNYCGKSTSHDIITWPASVLTIYCPTSVSCTHLYASSLSSYKIIITGTCNANYFLIPEVTIVTKSNCNPAVGSRKGRAPSSLSSLALNWSEQPSVRSVLAAHWSILSLCSAHHVEPSFLSSRREPSRLFLFGRLCQNVRPAGSCAQ